MHRSPVDDAAKIAALLGTLRGATLEVDVEAAVFARVRSLPAARMALPRVSLRQFAWGAFAAGMAGICGTLGVLALVGPTGPADASSALGAVGSALRSVFSAVLERTVSLAERATVLGPWLQLALGAAGQAAILVCIAMVALTLLVVAHEARSRRIAR